MTTTRFLVCDLGPTRLGFPVEAVSEVLRSDGLARVPWSHDWVAGVLNHQGRMYTVVDLGRFAAVPESAEPKVCVLLDHEELAIAFAVAGVEVVEARAAVQVSDLRFFLPDATWIVESLQTPDLEFHRVELSRVVDAVERAF